MIHDMIPHQWSSRVHDLVAAGGSLGSLAFIEAARLEAGLQIAVLSLTVIFLILGISMRATHFLKIIIYGLRGGEIKPPVEEKIPGDD